MDAVIAQNFGWRYPTRRSWSVRDITLAIPHGQRVLLLGSSGAGKSTLLAGLAGVLGQEGEQAGQLLVHGHNPATQRGLAGLVMQDPDSQVVLAKVGDDVAFGCENLNVPTDEIWPRVTDALHQVGLSVSLDHPTQELSGGQRQRLVLAGMLAMRPSVLLLDEPTANLDPAGVQEVHDAVARAVEDRRTTVIIVEHRTEIWLDLVDRVIVLDDSGGILADGLPTEVFERYQCELVAAGVWFPQMPTPQPWQPEPATDLMMSGKVAVGYRKNETVWSGEVQLGVGRVTCLTGPNGVGKSTLAMTLAGLQPPIAGEVLVVPQLAPRGIRQPHRWRSKELLTRIGTVFQEPEHQFVATTVQNEIMVGLRALKISTVEAAKRTDDLLTRLHLAKLSQAHPFTLSGGQKRRLSVATVLATRPEVMFFDEPTFGQDRRTWLELVAMVRELRGKGRTICTITHDEEWVQAVADRVWQMEAQPCD